MNEVPIAFKVHCAVCKQMLCDGMETFAPTEGITMMLPIQVQPCRCTQPEEIAITKKQLLNRMQNFLDNVTKSI